MDNIHQSKPMDRNKGYNVTEGGNSSSSPPLNGDGNVSHMEDGWRPHAEHGPPIDNPGADHRYEEDFKHQSNLWWCRMRHRFRNPAAEFLGTFTLVIFGDGAIASVLLSHNSKLPLTSQNKGEWQSISWGWGIGVMLGVYVAGCAGGHLNPAVTFAHCLFRGFPWKRLPGYALAQTLGAFCAAAVLYGNYRSAINEYEGGSNIRSVPGYSATPTAGIFATYPQPFLTTTGMFFSEFIGSAMLLFMIFVLKDDANLGAGNLVPLGLFFTFFGIGAALGWETGYALNLARDFGPRLFTYCVGYGGDVWSAGSYYFWIPMVAPFCGCAFGGLLYDLFIFSGESPINTPWMGLKGLVRPGSNKSNELSATDRQARGISEKV